MDEGLPELSGGQSAEEEMNNGGGGQNIPFGANSALDFPSVLHFLHLEWRRFESEKNQWELERNELKAKITLLEGERRGFEVLKVDLLRRIKMLEYALRQERSKSLALNTNVSSPAAANRTEDKPSSSQKDVITPLSAGDETKQQQENPLTKFASYSAATLGKNLTFGKSRTGTSRTKEILKQYLQEVGFDEKGGVNGDDFWMKGGGVKFQTLNPSSSSSSSTTRGNITVDKLFQPPHQPTTPSDGNQKSLKSSDTAAAAQNNLRTVDEDKKARRHKLTESIIYSGSDADKFESLGKDIVPEGDAWATIFHQSKKDKMKASGSSKKSPGGFFNAVDGELADLSVEEKSPDADSANGDGLDSKTKASSVATTASESQMWHPKFTLRSHMDVVKSLAFHPTDLILLTASEDGCMKYWNLEALANLKKPPADIEPQFIYRSSKQHVNSVVVSTMIPPDATSAVQQQLQNGCVYSGSSDGSIGIWGLPDRNIAPYSKYEYHNYHIMDHVSHSDAVWDIKLHPLKALMVSSSADGLVNCLDLNELYGGSVNNPLKASISIDGFVKRNEFKQPKSIPTCSDFLHSDINKLIVSYDNSQLKLFDIESGKPILTFEGCDSSYDGTRATQINKVVSHNACPLVVTAHEDRYIRFYDPRSAKCVHGMIAHLDAISSIDISPNGLVLASGGHDGSTRLWEISSYACLQEFTFHRKKFDEAIHSVLFHPRTVIPNGQRGLGGGSANSTNVSGGSAWLATGGADACAKLYSCQ